MRFYHVYRQMAALAGALLVAGCGERDFGQATPEAAAEYAEIIEGFNALKGEEWIEVELNSEAEVNALIVHFDRTADARYATPQSGLTLLHLACLFKKPELARCLLLDGANPNAQTRDVYGDAASTPLRFAISRGVFEGDTDAKIIQLVDLLIQNGANANIPIEHDLGLLATAAHMCENEAVARHLLKYVNTVTADDMVLIIERGWADLMEEVLKQKGVLTPEESETMVTLGHVLKFSYDGRVNRRMVEQFLSKGVDINTTLCGTTLLQAAAANLNFLEDTEFRTQWLGYIAFLLDKGADANLIAGAESEYAGLCAYDILANKDGALEALAAHGHVLSAPPLAMRDGVSLVDDLSRAGMRKMTAEQALPHLQHIASIFTPTEEQMHYRGFDVALLSAAEILQRISPQQAAEVINGSSLWSIAPHLHENEDDEMNCHHVSAASLIYILQDVKDVCIARDKILGIVQQALSINDHTLAAEAVELLGRDAGAADIITELCESPHIAVRAGAWGAKLQQKGLPRCTNGGVKQWLDAHGREADTEAIKTALLATSLEEMWYGNMTADRKKEFIEALRTIGAPNNAIKVYGEYADNMDNPTKLDELEAMGKDWRYELEITTARYILQHEADFLSPVSAK